MFKKLMVAAALCLPSAAQAQFQDQFTNFRTTQFGVAVTYMFRNVGTYNSPTIVGVGKDFTFTASQRMTDLCIARQFCNLNYTQPLVSGVQNGAFTIPPSAAAPLGERLQGGYFGGWMGGSGCALDRCLSQFAHAPQGYVFGCQVPNLTASAPPGPDGIPVVQYLGRTCAADGFAGWIAFDLSVSIAGTGPTGLDASDFVVTHSADVVFAGASLTSAPEPATWALMAFGLLAVAAVRRRRA